MTALRRLIAPIGFLLLLVSFAHAEGDLAERFGVSTLGEGGRAVVEMATFLVIAWLLSRLADAILSGLRPRKRPVPKLLRELVSALLFMFAIVSGVILLMGHGAGSALAGSGVLLALIGFAIRNVVADTLSGIALGVEAPFRIGDWVDIEMLARGRVIEIGWRTTRLLTRDSTYVILPNSQISRQRIVNYSEPRSEFRAQLEITLHHAIPVAEGAHILHAALKSAPLIKQTPAPSSATCGNSRACWTAPSNAASSRRTRSSP